MFCTPSAAQTAEPTTIVLFGATGDLARRKLLPGLYHLFVSGLLPERWRLIGSSADDLSDDDFRRHARSAIDEFGRVPSRAEHWEPFAAALSYVSGRF